MSPRRDPRPFLLLLATLSAALYANTFSSGYVWDDRAAIVGNADVHQGSALSDLFRHDFWGQDITAAGSHKSYRPLTVLSYRLNFYWTELSPTGFHVGNVVIYILTVCVFYLAAGRWISEEGSRVASLLFAAHPVHCEAVASLVGRADCLAGLCFLLALIFYSDALGRLRLTHSHTTSSSSWLQQQYDTGVILSNFILAMFFGLASSLSKEIGLTVFGVFVVLEALYVSSLSPSQKLSTHFLRDYWTSACVCADESDRGTEWDAVRHQHRGSCEGKRRSGDTQEEAAADELTRWVYLLNQRETANILPLKHYLFAEANMLIAHLSVGNILSLLTWHSVLASVRQWPRHGLSLLNYLQRVWVPNHDTNRGRADDNTALADKDERPLTKQRLKTFHECLVWFTRFPLGTYVRLCLHVGTLVCILLFRARLHGDTQLYQWTIMENPISLEPHWLTRALSYSHTHYLMLLKLLNPFTPHSCFDYGHYCLPIITSLWQAVNLLALLAYSLVFYLLCDTVLLARRSSLLALALSLLPLLPALNILFPVGTTLAERLLFVPSMGVALLVGEGCACAHSFRRLWRPVGGHWARLAVRRKIFHTNTATKYASIFPKLALYATLLPLLGIMSYRVVARNREWRDEFSIYSSALAVCPYNYKALTNTGMLLLNKDKARHAREAALLSDRALEVHDRHPTAFLNSALSHAADKKFVKAMYRYKQAERLENATNFKLLYQYMGGTLSDYVTHLAARGQGPTSSFLPLPDDGDEGDHSAEPSLSRNKPQNQQQQQRRKQREQQRIALISSAWNSALDLLSTDAGHLLDHSMQLGMDKPIALFSRASLAINRGTQEDFQLAVDLLEVVITKNKELMLLEQQGVPVEDTISLENAYNQRALALLSLKRYKEAEEHFLLAITTRPLLWEAYINLATLYFEMNKLESAKEVLITGAKMYSQAESGPLHLTFMIQQGYAEELLGDYAAAVEFYSQGVRLVEEWEMSGKGFEKSHADQLQRNLKNALSRV